MKRSPELEPELRHFYDGSAALFTAILKWTFLVILHQNHPKFVAFDSKQAYGKHLTVVGHITM